MNWHKLVVERSGDICSMLRRAYERAVQNGAHFGVNTGNRERVVLYADGKVDVGTYNKGTYTMAEHNGEAYCIAEKTWEDPGESGFDFGEMSEEEIVKWYVAQYADEWLDETYEEILRDTEGAK